jgi:saccharopine dehydrogenase-like NADP-dependent oxidoreductase
LKHIVIFGAGKSSTYLIEYLLRQLPLNNWTLSVLDADLRAAQLKIGHTPNAFAEAVDVSNEVQRNRWVKSADIVISLLPPSLHYLVAIDCVYFGKNLLTASYVDSKMEGLREAINNKGLLFLCEMGLDPGIDHMSAIKIIRELQNKGAVITSFRSHCGGLVAPESDDNPWHYKVSWNPRNIVLAGKSGAVYREKNREISLPYEELFDSNNVVDIAGLGSLSYYPNRDSLGYIKQYHLDQVNTFIRTTLRHPEFCFGWKNIIQLKLTDETIQYDTDGLTLKRFFQLHLNQHGFSEWIENQLTARFLQTKLLLEKLQQLLSAEEEVDEEQMKELQEFMMVDGKGKLFDVNLDAVKTKAAATVAGQMHEANLSMKQLFFLGMDDDETVINNGLCSAADILQFILEKKLALGPDDRDMIVMLHEIDYKIGEENNSIKSSLIVKGENNVRTAMAKTVGLPLAIATKLILQGKIKTKGLQIPIVPEIYEQVLEELKEYGIQFFESE